MPADTTKREIAAALVTLGRPRFVMAGFFLFVLGCLSAVCLGAPFSAGRFIWGYAIVGCAHFGVHYLNDYADRFSDNPDCRSPVSGGSGILPCNPELAGTALVLAVLLSLTSVLLAAGFVLFFSWSSSFILFVLAGILLSWSYSAPPVRLCGRCLGESATMLAFGLFLPGSGYFVMNGSLDTRFFLFALPLLVLGFFLWALREVLNPFLLFLLLWALLSQFRGKPGHGALFEGDKACLVADFGRFDLFPRDKASAMAHYKPRPEDKRIPPLGGFQAQWVNACKGDLKTSSNFDYSGTMIEQLLLGLVAFRVGGRIEYDGAAGRVTNNAAANALLRRKYREGWTLDG